MALDMCNPPVVCWAAIPWALALTMPVLGGTGKTTMSVQTFDVLPFTIDKWIEQAMVPLLVAAGADQLKATQEVSAGAGLQLRLGTEGSPFRLRGKLMAELVSNFQMLGPLWLGPQK